MYTRESIINCGLMDEKYHNTTEHIDHSYRLCLAGYCTGMWCFPDVSNSSELIDISNHHKKSSYNRDITYTNNIKHDYQHFKQKFGVYPIEIKPIDFKQKLTEIINK